MTDLRELARPDIDAAARHTPPLAALERRADQIRRRRRIGRSVGGLAAIAVGAVAVLAVADQPTEVETAGSGDPAVLDAGLTIQRIEAKGSDSGTAEVTVVFDAPIATGDVGLADDIASLGPDDLAVVVQPPGAVHVCDAVHSFPAPSQGSVDLLIPASWLAGDPPVIPGVTALEPTPNKVVTCGPHEGHVQVSMWGAAPEEAERIEAAVSGDRTRIVVQIVAIEPWTTPAATSPARSQRSARRSGSGLR